MRKKQKKYLYILGFIAVGVIAGIIFASSMNWTSQPFAAKESTTVGSQRDTPASLLDLQNTAKAFTAVSEEVLPSVVSIATTKTIERSDEAENFWGPLLKEFFGQQFEQRIPDERRLQGLGSGVIISNDGHIITNHHVIANADDIKVTTHNNQEYEATLVGTDPLTEIAVIQITKDDLPVARLGDSESLEIGEWVLAFGNPLYLTSTVTAGIVSAKGRSIGIIRDQEAGPTGGSYAIENFIQTDAAINPGNSGGALVNLDAQVMGINTAIASQTGGYQGYGFAVPINLAKKISNDLIEQGYVTRAWLGISMRPVSENVAERFNMDRPRGVLIDRVMQDSPAADAGLQALDIILNVDGEDIERSNEVQNVVALKDPGDTINLTILRDGEQIEKEVELGERERRQETAQKQDEEGVRKLGLTVQNLTENINDRLPHDYYDPDNGVIVTNVNRFSAAFDAGIRIGDFITKIEEQDVDSVSEFKNALNDFSDGKVVIFNVQRGNTTMHPFVKLPQEEG